jgi:hypothetical protein
MVSPRRASTSAIRCLASAFDLRSRTSEDRQPGARCLTKGVKLTAFLSLGPLSVVATLGITQICQTSPGLTRRSEGCTTPDDPKDDHRTNAIPTMDGVSDRDKRPRRSQIGSELPLFGPIWLLFDRLLAATRSAPPRLYRILWGQQQPAHSQRETAHFSPPARIQRAGDVAGCRCSSCVAAGRLAAASCGVSPRWLHDLGCLFDCRQ